MTKKVETKVNTQALINAVQNANTLDECNEGVTKVLELVNKGFTSNNIPYGTLNELLATLDECVKLYNARLRAEEYSKFLKTNEPIISMLRQLTVDQVRIKRNDANEEVNHKTVELNDITKELSLFEFADYAKEIKAGNPLASEEWVDYIGAFKVYMSKRIIKDVKSTQGIDDVEDTTKLKKYDKKVSESDKSLCAVAQLIINSIVGTDKVTMKAEDLNYLKLAITGKGRTPATIKRIKENTIASIFANICHKELCGKTYKFEVKAK